MLEAAAAMMWKRVPTLADMPAVNRHARRRRWHVWRWLRQWTPRIDLARMDWLEVEERLRGPHITDSGLNRSGRITQLGRLAREGQSPNMRLDICRAPGSAGTSHDAISLDPNAATGLVPMPGLRIIAVNQDYPWGLRSWK